MNTPIEVLYTYATKRDDLTHWLPNEDIVDTHRRSAELSHKLNLQLSDRLSPEDISLFRKLMDNLRDVRQLETEMLFYQGLAMGLQLGAMTMLV